METSVDRTADHSDRDYDDDDNDMELDQLDGLDLEPHESDDLQNAFASLRTNVYNRLVGDAFLS